MSREDEYWKKRAERLERELVAERERRVAAERRLDVYDAQCLAPAALEIVRQQRRTGS